MKKLNSTVRLLIRRHLDMILRYIVVELGLEKKRELLRVAGVDKLIGKWCNFARENENNE
jgi:hypothetical protein